MAHARWRCGLLRQVGLPIAIERCIINMRDQPVPAIINAVVMDQPIAHRVLGGGLQGWVKAGMDDQAALHWSAAAPNCWTKACRTASAK